MEYGKVKSVSKQVVTKGKALDAAILDTMKTVSAVVGATLGPGGQPVLIERFEHGLPAMVTKDGVTVFRSLGFDDSTRHCIMECARDAAVRTASEAGDGTTTATVLAEAIVRLTHRYCKDNPRTSPQRVVRHLERMFREHIEPGVKAMAIKPAIDDATGRFYLHSVAKVSANGDADLADAVMKCFDMVGDDGNVTIAESNGPSHYEVERIEGYPVAMGYEESCAKFYPKFINDPGTQRCVMEKPVFVVYHGRITEIQTVVLLMEQIAQAWQNQNFPHNVVLVATGFSESVLGSLSVNFAEPASINVFPLLVPQSPMPNGQLHFLEDVCAITDAELFDPLNRPLDQATLEDLGLGCRVFEATRFRSSIIGHANDDTLLVRIDELQVQAQNPESELDRMLLQERIAKLSGGIAKLKVIGASNGELKEKRDRAEDAVCAVRGTIKHGCVPGGGWVLMKLCNLLPRDPITDSVLRPALMEPVYRILTNCGIVDDEEWKSVLAPILIGIASNKTVVYDALEGRHVDAFTGGILDSTPAVLEAIRNSISIASLLGTLGGAVVFKRDLELERSEAQVTQQFLRDANTNPADERG